MRGRTSRNWSSPPDDTEMSMCSSCRQFVSMWAHVIAFRHSGSFGKQNQNQN
jgi:hypothetical protein